MLLSHQEWTQRRRHHEERVDAVLADHLARRATGAKHPVEDFLFTYYSFRPNRLRRWHPGAGVGLQGARREEFGSQYVPAGRESLCLDVKGILATRGDSVRWIRDLLVATGERAPQFGCFGMHEWAMVYRQPVEQVRHNAVALRLGPQGTAAVVDEVRIRCSHFDAFRFFTATARPLNELQPARDTQMESEQPGCLHANMDVYRWPTSFLRWSPANC